MHLEGYVSAYFERTRSVQMPAHRSALPTRLGAGDPVFAFAPEISKIVFTTNAIRSLHMRSRKIKGA